MLSVLAYIHLIFAWFTFQNILYKCQPGGVKQAIYVIFFKTQNRGPSN